MSEKLPRFMPDRQPTSRYLREKFAAYAKERDFSTVPLEVCAHIRALDRLREDLKYECDNFASFINDPNCVPQPQGRKLAEALYVATCDFLELIEACYGEVTL